MVNMITPRQVAFLNRLQDEREVSSATSAALDLLRNDYRHRKATTEKASAVISLLLSEPMKRADLQPGIYEAGDGALYRCYLGQNSGRMLVKQVFIQDGCLSYEYVGRADKMLSGTRRLSREEVAERTLSYGSKSCLVCGRLLTDPESVDRGIGPVCWGEYS